MLSGVIGAFEGRKRKKPLNEEMPFHQDNVSCHKSIKIMANLYEMLVQFIFLNMYISNEI